MFKIKLANLKLFRFLLIIALIAFISCDTTTGKKKNLIVPTSHNWGKIGVSGSVSFVFNVVNYTNEVVNVTSTFLSGIDQVEFKIGTGSITFAVQLQPAASHKVTVEFNPTSAGNKQAVFNVGYQDSFKNAKFAEANLYGEGTIAPVILVQGGSTYDFGNIIENSAKDKTFVLQNTGSGNLNISKIEVIGTDFNIKSGWTGSAFFLLPGRTHDVIVTFLPTSIANFAGSLKIEHDASNETSPYTVTLNGDGVAAAAQFAILPTSKDFGQQTVGNATQPFDFTVTNNGNIALQITAITFTGTNSADFSTTATPTNVAIGTSIQIPVIFTPSAAGKRTASLEITHNATGSPSSTNVEGEGVTAPIPMFDIAPTSKDFGQQTINTASSAFNFTVTNNGTANLDITAISFTGTNSTDFSSTATTPINILPSQTAQIPGVFQPAVVGNKAATLEITHNASGSPAQVSLSGQGTAPPSAAVIFSEDFENGAKYTWTVNNAGSGGTPPFDTWFIQDEFNTIGAHPNITPTIGNFTPGSKDCISCDSDAAGNPATLDEDIFSPVIDCSAYTTGMITLEFDGIFQELFDEQCGVYIFDGAQWLAVEIWTQSWSTNGAHKSYDVSAYALGNASFKIGFNYFDKGNWGVFFQVDNVKLSHTP